MNGKAVMSKRFKAKLYMESKLSFKSHSEGFLIEYHPQKYLFSGGRYPTKILAEELPEWYIYGYIYKRHGYISAKGVKHLVYKPNYFINNHLHKYDTLFISYADVIEPYIDDMGFSWYKGYEHAIGGSLILSFVEAVEKFTDYNVREIKNELKRKRSWYYANNPCQYK